MTWSKYNKLDGFETDVKWPPQNSHAAYANGVYMRIRKQPNMYFHYTSQPVPSCCGATWWHGFTYINPWHHEPNEFAGTSWTDEFGEGVKSWLRELLSSQFNMVFGIVHHEKTAQETYYSLPLYIAMEKCLREVGDVIATFRNPNHDSTLLYLAFNPQRYGRNYDFQLQH